MQWRHGCRAMRRSVCNAGASNAGRSLCVQISRERSYSLPVYWYHSKGNWLRYNFAAERFYIMKKFAADSSSFIVEIAQKTTNLGNLSPLHLDHLHDGLDSIAHSNLRATACVQSTSKHVSPGQTPADKRPTVKFYIASICCTLYVCLV